mmetsp:Transcript_12636/g.18916  ORF Transcript_12636/g.18916 Transcript_12636/m.18916 type:complete len:322 (+) Transcript_12636:37-1002(+)
MAACRRLLASCTGVASYVFLRRELYACRCENNYGKDDVDALKKRTIKGEAALTEAKGYDPYLQGDNFYARICQSLTIGTLGLAAYTFMHGLNKTKVIDGHKLKEVAYKRKPEYRGRGMISVSNHVSAIDDPMLPSAMWTIPQMFWPFELRWVFCSIDRCFKKPWLGRVLTSTKVIPVERGGGLEQFAIRFATEKLNKGEWIHLFPEGTRSRDNGKSINPFKAGVGKLLTAPAKCPVVVPFYHHGMHNILPVGARNLRRGKTVHVIVGDPIFLEEFIAEHRRRGTPEKELYTQIALRLENAVRDLQKQSHQYIVYPSDEKVE